MPVKWNSHFTSPYAIHTCCYTVHSYPRESEGMFSPALVCLSVCLSVCVCVCVCVCDHDNEKDCGRICTKFYAKVSRGKGKTNFVSRYDRLRDVELAVKKLRKPAIVYKIAPSGNSELAGRKIVGVASAAKCWRQKRSCGDLYSLRVFSI